MIIDKTNLSEAPYQIKIEAGRLCTNDDNTPRFPWSEADLRAIVERFDLFFMFDFGYDKAEPGDYYYKVAALRIDCYLPTEEPKIIPTIRDENGDIFSEVTTGRDDILFLATWPHAPQLPFIPDPNYAHVGAFRLAGQQVFIPNEALESHRDGTSFWINSDPPDYKNRATGSDLVGNIRYELNGVKIVPTPVFQLVRKATPAYIQKFSLTSGGAFIGTLTFEGFEPDSELRIVPDLKDKLWYDSFLRWFKWK